MRSGAAFAESARYLAGGVTRQAGYWHPYPITIVRGEGSAVWDVDGNEYIDGIYNYSALVHGHAYPPIVVAARAALASSTAWLGNCAAQSELAQMLVERIPSVERIRFTNSGSEAAYLALAIARAVTGRHRFLMARHGYHGAIGEFAAGSFDLPGPRPYVARYNDLDEFEAVLGANGNEIAAVFLEPVWTSGGVVQGTKQFLEGALTAAHRAGAVFVLDEVVTLRLGIGGAQGNLGLEPDLTMLAKVIGGGFPVGAVGGKREHMSLLDPTAPKAVSSGTFNGNPVSMAAGVVSVRDLTADRIDSMGGLAGRLKAGLIAAAEQVGLPIRINQAGSILGVAFQTHEPDNPFLRDDRRIMSRFHLAALNHGVLLAPRGMIALATVMTTAVVDEMIGRLGAAMADVVGEAV
ncbi:MAG: aminotransferase class III-fold pyridoxal phosphate-dependent enzyme [Gemmatimonadota bacterium]